MQRILSKRVLRDIRENLLRYLALFFLVALVMYMVVAIVGAAETIMPVSYTHLTLPTIA